MTQGEKLQAAYMAGASASLKKSMAELMEFMNNDGKMPTKDLRPFLHGLLGDLSALWFKKGFNRGHRETYRVSKPESGVPVRLEFGCKRRLSPNQHRNLVLKSKIKKKDR